MFSRMSQEGATSVFRVHHIYTETALQITDPSSRQRGRPKKKSKAIVRQKKMKKKNLVMGSKGVSDTKTDRPTDRRSQHQLNSTYIYMTTHPKTVTRMVMSLRSSLCYS
jgi:hypothetical protein